MGGSTRNGGHDDEPLLRVVRGTPTATELAAMVVAVRVAAARRSASPDSGPPVSAPSAWVRSMRAGAATTGLPTERGPRAWRASTLPR